MKTKEDTTMCYWEGQRVTPETFSRGLVQLMIGSKVVVFPEDRRAILSRAVQTGGASLARLSAAALAILLFVGAGCGAPPGPDEGDADGMGGRRTGTESPPLSWDAPPASDTTMPPPGMDSSVPPPPSDSGTQPPPADSGPTPGDVACRGLATGDLCAPTECAGSGSGSAAGSAFLRRFRCEKGLCVGQPVEHCPKRCSGTLVIPQLCQPGTANQDARCIDDTRFPNLLEDCGRQNATCQMVNISQCHPEIASCTAAACIR